jgi:hypothetical protein
LKKQIIFSIIILTLFIALNTSYLWEDNSGFFALAWGVFLLFTFLIIGIVQLINIGKIIFKEKFEFKRILLNLFNIVLLTILFFYPNGIIKPKETRKIFLEAFTEGAANCTTTLKLFENKDFKELNICFGITSAEGKYRIENDTVYFDTKIIPKHSDRYYDFALIKNNEKGSEIIRFYKQDSIGKKLKIKLK